MRALSLPRFLLRLIGASALMGGVLGAVGPAAAKEPVDPFTEPDDADLFRAEQRVVTVASRSAENVRDAPSIVTLVTDKQIRERGYRKLSDLLQSIPGVYVSPAQEGRSVAWFRGVVSPDNNKFLLLVDGVPWYDGVYTHAWIDEYLPLEIIKQVELIKGPGSAVYGTNAFAGVINVVTYRASDLHGGFVRGVVGNDGRRGLSAVYAEELGTGRLPVELRAHARALQIDGDGLDANAEGERNVVGTAPRQALSASFDLLVAGLRAKVDVIDYQHTYYTQPQDSALGVILQDDDTFWLAYRNTMASLSYAQRLGSWGTLTPSVYHQRYDNSSHYAFFSDPETVQADDGTLSTTLKSTLVEAEKLTSAYGGGLSFEARPNTRNHTVAGAGIDVVRVLKLRDDTFQDGEGVAQEPSGFSVRDPDAQISDMYVYAQHTLNAAWWLQLTAGGRVDLHSYFGPFATPRAGVLFIPSDVAVLKLLYGRAFRAPNARELLVTVTQDDEGVNNFVAGNEKLRPETIDTVEAEVTVNPLRAMELRVAGFGSFIRDEISTLKGPSDGPLGTDFYGNSGQTNILGAEAQWSWTPGAWTVDLSGSATAAQDVSDDREQYGFPPLMGHAVLGRELVAGVRLHLLADTFGRQPRAEWAPQSKLPDGDPYTLLHLGLATEELGGSRVRADVSVRNLLGAEYATMTFYDQANATTTNDAGRTVARYPNDLQGEGRTIQVGLELPF
jgi:iron complex outermembrane receptor protein